MQIKYFPDTDTLFVVFNENDVAETRDIDENINIDLDKDGAVVSMTVEHAKERTDVSSFSFQQVFPQKEQ